MVLRLTALRGNWLHIRKMTLLSTKQIELKMELMGTEAINASGKNIEATLAVTSHSSFPETKDINYKETIRKAQKNLETDLQSLGWFQGPYKQQILEDVRTMGIPTWVSKTGNLNILDLYGQTSMLFTVFFFSADDTLDHKKESEPNKYVYNPSILKNYISAMTKTLEGKGYNTSSYESSDLNTEELRKLKLLHLLIDKIVRNFSVHVPEFTKGSNRNAFTKLVRSWLLCYLWWATYNPSMNDSSKGTRFFYRQKCVGMDMAAEVFCILKGIFLEDEIRDDPMFKRTIDVMTNYCFTLNDLTGFAKDYRKNDFDSLIYCNYKHGSTVKKEFEKGVQRLKIEHDEYIKISNQLRRLYPENENLNRYIDSLDFTFAGQISFYSNALRYGQNKYSINGQHI